MKGIDSFGYLDVNGRIILKSIFRTGLEGGNFFWNRIGTEAYFFEHRNKPSFSIKDAGFLYYISCYF
jgi:hypothetical protein